MIDYLLRMSKTFRNSVVVKGTTGIKDTHTASLYELAFTAPVGTRRVMCQANVAKLSNKELR